MIYVNLYQNKEINLLVFFISLMCTSCTSD